MDGLPPEVGDAAAVAAVDAFRAIMLAAQEFRNAVADHIGVNVTDTLAMSYLAARGPMNAGELASALHVASSSTTTLIDRLEKSGLARRTRTEDDRRTVVVEVTEAGLETLVTVRRRMLQILTAADLPDLGETTEMLDALARELRSHAAQVRERPGDAISE